MGSVYRDWCCPLASFFPGPPLGSEHRRFYKCWLDDNQSPSLTVKTDSSGYAKVYLLPGNTAATYTVEYAVMTQTSPTVLSAAAATSSISVGAINEQFTATAIQSRTVTGDYTIDRGNPTTESPVRSDLTNDSPMIVRVSGRAANVLVNFAVTGGQITQYQNTGPYSTSLSTTTNADGDATVYVKLNRNSSATVTARIDGNYEDAGTHTVTYFSSTPYIVEVSGDDQVSTTGSRLANPLVVRVLDGVGGRPAPGQVVKFE